LIQSNCGNQIIFEQLVPGLPSGRVSQSQKAMGDGEQASFDILFKFMQYQTVTMTIVIKRMAVLTMERRTKVIICSVESAPEKIQKF